MDPVCSITHETLAPGQAIESATIRPALKRMLQTDYPDWDGKGVISKALLAKYRRRHLQNLLQKSEGEISELEAEVMQSIAEEKVLVQDPDEEDAAVKLSTGQYLADNIAKFGGSWTFILSFGAVLILWILVNTLLLVKKPFDPFPFILLNLILSCLAAIQAPVIMMSQNRQEEKDRNRARNDYQVNLKAELEIRQLHEKIDHLIHYQMTTLNRFEAVQSGILDYLSEEDNLPLS